jgi:hypothetical protein
MEPETSLPSSEESATGHPEADESDPSYFSKVHFIIVSYTRPDMGAHRSVVGRGRSRKIASSSWIFLLT